MADPGHGEEGRWKSNDQLLPEIYNELRRIAARKMANEAPGQTLQPTALVHEAWLRLMGDSRLQSKNRAYFFAAAGEAMRRILVENARRKKRLKRGGNLERLNVEDVNLPAPLPDDDLLAMNDALDRFAQEDPRGAEFVKLYFFVGLSQEEIAKELGVSLATVERTWAFARAWLFREIKQGRKPVE